MGMTLRARRRNARKEAEAPVHRGVPYKFATYEHDREGKKFKSNEVVYSFWSASKYVLVLSIMLWWLPMFGQMIAGYVGGRRAGGPWRGIAASIVPVVAIYGVLAGFSTGLIPSHLYGVTIAPAALVTVLNTNIPLLSPYLQFSTQYVGAFVKGLAGVSPYGINTYVLTVAFAYVGGVLAEQNRREIEYTSRAAATNTTVFINDPSAFGPQHMPHAWLSGVGSMFHLPGMHTSGDQRMVYQGRKDAWASAQGVECDDRVLNAGDTEEMYGDREMRFYDPRAREVHKSKHHHHKNRGYPRPHGVDPWKARQNRRGAPNYSAKPRFRYQQYENSGRQSNPRRRDGGFSKFVVSPNQKSIRRAERIIDSEWGHSSYPRFSEVDDGRPDDMEETEAVAVPKPKDHHRPVHQWDQI